MARFFSIFCFAFAALFTSSVNAQFSDNFDSYGTGVDVHGMNGWKGWDNNPAFSALTSDTQALSAPNSIEITDTTDLINEVGNPTSGRWLVTIDQFIPANHDGVSFFIMQNRYNDNGPYAWSVELAFAGNGEGLGGVFDDFQFDEKNMEFLWSGPLIVEGWVQIKVCIDLDQDTVRQYYDGVLIPNNAGPTALQWSARGGPGSDEQPGVTEIGAINLFATPGASTIYYDNLVVTQIVLGDADDDGVFNNEDIAAFVLALTDTAAYQAMFPNVDLDCQLDMNGDGVFDNNDIAAFVAALTGG